MAVRSRSEMPGMLTVLINAAHEHTVAGNPIPTPMVNLQPRIPAMVIGMPSKRQNASHINAGIEKLVPLPSVAGPCRIG